MRRRYQYGLGGDFRARRAHGRRAAAWPGDGARCARDAATVAGAGRAPPPVTGPAASAAAAALFARGRELRAAERRRVHRGRGRPQRAAVLAGSRGARLQRVVCARRQVGGVHVDARRLRRPLPRSSRRNQARAAHRQPRASTIRACCPRRTAARVRVEPQRPGRHLDARAALRRSHERHELAGRGLSSAVVPRRRVARILVGSRLGGSEVHVRDAAFDGAVHRSARRHRACVASRRMRSLRAARSGRTDGKSLYFYEADVDEVQKIRSPLRLRATTQIARIDVAGGQRRTLTTGAGEKWSPRRAVARPHRLRERRP